jgi:molybdate transport system regulatory protein
MTSYPRASLRIEIDHARRVGPGKIRLLELIRSTGSISAAARQMEMSYRRAWLLIDEVNGALKAPVVATATGGSGGGGAVLTPFGEALIAAYRDIEADATAMVAGRIEALAGKREKRGDAAGRVGKENEK